MSDATEPVLTLRLPFLFGWEQHQPGGCRCLCRLYHNTKDSGACLLAAVPGLLIRVEAGTQSQGPLPVCRSCYTLLAPLANSYGESTQ